MYVKRNVKYIVLLVYGNDVTYISGKLAIIHNTVEMDANLCNQPVEKIQSNAVGTLSLQVRRSSNKNGGTFGRHRRVDRLVDSIIGSSSMLMTILIHSRRLTSTTNAAGVLRTRCRPGVQFTPRTIRVPTPAHVHVPFLQSGPDTCVVGIHAPAFPLPNRRRFGMVGEQPKPGKRRGWRLEDVRRPESVIRISRGGGTETCVPLVSTMFTAAPTDAVVESSVVVTPVLEVGTVTVTVSGVERICIWTDSEHAVLNAVAGTHLVTSSGTGRHHLIFQRTLEIDARQIAGCRQQRQRQSRRKTSTASTTAAAIVAVLKVVVTLELV